MVGFIYQGHPNRTPGDELLPRGVGWETVNLHGPDPLVRSGWNDPRGFPSEVRRRFHPDGTLVMVYQGHLLVAIPDTWEPPFGEEEEARRVHAASGGCPAGWNVAEVRCRAFLLANLDRIPPAAYRSTP
jgi:hypothetical protein